MSGDRIIEINQKKIILIVGIAIALTIIIIGISWLTVSKHSGEAKKDKDNNITEINVASNNFISEKEESMITRNTDNPSHPENKEIKQKKSEEPLLSKNKEEDKSNIPMSQKKSGEKSYQEKTKIIPENKAESRGKWIIQVGAFKFKENASKALTMIKGKGFKVEMKNEGGLFKIVAGSFKDRETADTQAEKIRKAGFDCKILPVNK